MQKCNFHYAAMSMMTSRILKSVDFTKTQNSRYLANETFFIQIKKLMNYIRGQLLYGKNTFAAQLTFEIDKLDSTLCNDCGYTTNNDGVYKGCMCHPVI